MIVRESGTKTLSCDDCGETLDQSFPDGQFNDLIAHAKSESWSIKPDGEGGWRHLCIDCRRCLVACNDVRGVDGLPERGQGVKNSLASKYFVCNEISYKIQTILT